MAPGGGALRPRGGARGAFLWALAASLVFVACSRDAPRKDGPDHDASHRGAPRESAAAGDGAPRRLAHLADAIMAEIPIAEGKALVFETWTKRLELRSGDRVVVDFHDGVFRVNGLVHQPHSRPPAPHEFNVEFLKTHFNNVPRIIEAVAAMGAGAGDEGAAWNEAFRAWGAARDSLARAVAAAYAADVAAGAPPDAAAARAVTALRTNPLVESSRGDSRAGSPERAARVVFLGVDDAEEVPLAAQPVEPPLRAAPMTRESAEKLLATLRRELAAGGEPTRIELRFGTIRFVRDPEAAE